MYSLKNFVNTEEEYQKLLNVAMDIMTGKAKEKYCTIGVFGPPSSGKSTIRVLFEKALIITDDYIGQKYMVASIENVCTKKRVLYGDEEEYFEGQQSLYNNYMVFVNDDSCCIKKDHVRIINENNLPIVVFSRYKNNVHDIDDSEYQRKICAINLRDPNFSYAVKPGNILRDLKKEIEDAISRIEKCKKSALCLIFCLKLNYNKDISTLLGKYLYKTRYEVLWL